jgi:hypothetical protein
MYVPQKRVRMAWHLSLHEKTKHNSIMGLDKRHDNGGRKVSHFTIPRDLIGWMVPAPYVCRFKISS